MFDCLPASAVGAEPSSPSRTKRRTRNIIVFDRLTRDSFHHSTVFSTDARSRDSKHFLQIDGSVCTLNGAFACWPPFRSPETAARDGKGNDAAATALSAGPPRVRTRADRLLRSLRTLCRLGRFADSLLCLPWQGKARQLNLAVFLCLPLSSSVYCGVVLFLRVFADSDPLFSAFDIGVCVSSETKLYAHV